MGISRSSESKAKGKCVCVLISGFLVHYPVLVWSSDWVSNLGLGVQGFALDLPPPHYPFSYP